MSKTIRFKENSLIAIKEKLNEIMVGTDGVSHNDVSGNVKLYHGTDILGLVSILKTNRMCASEGTQHGETRGINWFSLNNGGNFNKGACLSIEVPKSDFDTMFKMMNRVDVQSKDSALNISSYNPQVEYFCGHTRESLNNCYRILTEKGEKFPIEWMRDNIFYDWCEKSGNEDTYMAVEDRDFGLVMSNVLGDEFVRKEGFINEEVGENREIYTDEFKNWFGDWENVDREYFWYEEDVSKVVDDNLMPKVVKHGTPNRFKAFDPNKIGSTTDHGWLGTGFYFYGNNDIYASQYAGHNGVVMECYLNIRNPYIASGEDMDKLSEADSKEASDDFRYMLEGDGYDGVYYNGDLNEEWVAFYPEQIRLVGSFGVNENTGEEFAPVTTIGGEEKDGDVVAAGNYFHMAESIDFDNNGMSINDDKILGKYNLKDLILSKTGNYVTLNKIVANELGKGNGSRFMEELTRMADKNGWILALTPDTSFGGSSVGRLKKFYKRFGFVPNKGRSTDFNTRESMIRKPCELKKNIIIPENRFIALKENLEPEVSSSEVDLSSFKKRDSLPPGIWKDEETLNSRVRLKLLDIADDFWEFVNLTWVEPKGIIITGSICNFNWSKFSDIDLHLIVDFNEIDEKTEFVKQYLDSKKNEWNTEHERLKIMGFPVELYVQDVNDNVEAGGIYDLEENTWIRKPNPHTIKSIGLNKFNIKDKAAEIMTIIDDMYDKLSTTTDGHVVDEIGDDAHYLWDKVKDMRKKSLSKNGESGSGNIVYKVLRRTGYLDKLFKLFSRVYDRSNSISESMKKYLTVLKEEVAIDGSSENNPYEKRWKAEREALKSFVANYGKLMQSKEDNKGGKLYKVYFDETMSNLIGYNYCICVQWNEQEMKPGSTVYIRALDKFTPFIRRNLQFDTRGRDNMRGTYDDNRFVRESVDELNLYHSSYSNFNKFNHRKYLSSGAGSQTFGWGTYLTDSFPIAESYAGKFIWQKFNEFVVSAEPEDYIGNASQYNDEIVKEACRLYRSIVRTRIVFTYGIERKYNRNFFDCNFEVTGDPAEEYDNVLKEYEKFKEEFKEVIEKQAEAGRPLSDEQLRKAFYVLKNGNEILDTPRDEYIATTTARNSVNSLVKLIINNIWDAADNHVKKESYIYEVEIPDDNGYNYLDYSNQVSPEIAKLISNGVMKLYRRFGNKIDTNRLDNAVEECLNGRMKGKYLYEELTSALGGSEKAASLFLNQCGIVGIKYRAGTIYGLPDGADESSLNYVIFDSNNVRITSKNLFTDNF